MKTLDELIKEIVRDRLLRFDGNRTQTAKSLDISPRTIRNYIDRYGIGKKAIPKAFEQNSDNIKTDHLRSVRKRRPVGRPVTKTKTDEYDWQIDPFFDTGYEEPTPEQRDDWYNRDFF